jgi:eukaryotic-like serine/threonine-protein kinase
LRRVHEALGSLDRRPVLLVLDDLQWADPWTLDFLRFSLAGGQPDQPRPWLLGTFRDEEAPAGLLELASCPLSRSLELGRLEDAAVREMIHEMRGAEAPDGELLQLVTREAGGNPFFAAEYLRTALETGWLGPDGIALRPGGKAGQACEALPLPGAIRDLLSPRLDVLDARAVRLAEAAAVLGPELDERQLGAAAGMRGSELAAAVGELLERRVLRAAAGGRLRFVHDEMRSAVRERISSDRMGPCRRPRSWPASRIPGRRTIRRSRLSPDRFLLAGAAMHRPGPCTARSTHAHGVEWLRAGGSL